MIFSDLHLDSFAEIHGSGFLDVEYRGVRNSDLGDKVVSTRWERPKRSAHLNAVTHVLGLEDDFSDSFDPFFPTRDGIRGKIDGLCIGPQMYIFLALWFT